MITNKKAKILLLLLATASSRIATAFCGPSSSSPPSAPLAVPTTTTTTTPKKTDRKRRQRRSFAFFSSSSSDHNSDDDDNDGNNNAATELTNQLAQLDKTFKIVQRGKSNAERRWTEFYLEENDDDNNDQRGEPTTTDGNKYKQQKDMVYLLEPPSNLAPACTLVFVGGAGLGQFPHIAYNELLIRLSDRLNAAIIAVPYPILTLDLDHFEWSKNVGERARKALEQCQKDPSKRFPARTYCLAHSLGCKLATIYMAATTRQKFDGVGLISFNNYSFGKTIAMAKQFSETIERSSPSSFSGDPFAATSGKAAGSQIIDQVLNWAESAVSMIGLDFTPNPEQMERLIAMKFDKEMQSKTRMFTFDDDTLDNTQDFVNACDGSGPGVSCLPGTHLTPVYFRLGLDQLPEEMRDLSSEGLGGFVSASFGDEEELNALVDEVCGWILYGNPPSRPPKWLEELPQIASGPSSSSSSDFGPSTQ